MTNFEMVEMLREKANVSYEEAKAALEAADWDLLDAVLLLEKEGKVPLGFSSYSTRTEEEPEAKEKNHKDFRSALRWLAREMGKLLRIGNTNSLVVSRRGEELFSLPVTVFVILMFCSVWTILFAMAFSLFFGVRYSFSGPNLGKDSINRVMNKAADVAENVKNEIGGQEKDSDEAK